MVEFKEIDETREKRIKRLCELVQKYTNDGITDELLDKLSQIFEKCGLRQYRNFWLESRYKSPESIAEKVMRQEKKGKKGDIHDLVGATVVVPCTYDIAEILPKLRENFKVVDEKDHREDDSRAYYGVNLKVQFNGIAIEIQVKDLMNRFLQKIDHDLIYKNNRILQEDKLGVGLAVHQAVRDHLREKGIRVTFDMQITKEYQLIAEAAIGRYYLREQAVVRDNEGVRVRPKEQNPQGANRVKTGGDVRNLQGGNGVK